MSKMTYEEAFSVALYYPEFYSRTCMATIPASWRVTSDDGYVLADADTREEAAKIASGKERMVLSHNKIA